MHVENYIAEIENIQDYHKQIHLCTITTGKLPSALQDQANVMDA
jgi:hypothetical protein